MSQFPIKHAGHGFIHVDHDGIVRFHVDDILKVAVDSDFKIWFRFDKRSSDISIPIPSVKTPEDREALMAQWVSVHIQARRGRLAT